MKSDRRKADPPPPQAGVELSGFDSLKALWRIRPFRRLWLVLGVSSMGDWLGLLASAIFASNNVSGSAAKGLAFGSVVAVRMLPALILGPMAGVVADRWDRRYEPGRPDPRRALLQRADLPCHRADGVLRHPGDRRPAGRAAGEETLAVARVRGWLGLREQDPAGTGTRAGHSRRLRGRRGGG